MGGDIKEGKPRINVDGIIGRVQDTIAKRDHLDPEDIVFSNRIVFQGEDNTYGFLQLFGEREIVGITFPNDANVYFERENILIGDSTQVVRKYLAEEGSIDSECIPFIDIDGFLQVPGSRKNPKAEETMLLLKDHLNNQTLVMLEDGSVSQYTGDIRPDYTEEIPEPDDE